MQTVKKLAQPALAIVCSLVILYLTLLKRTVLPDYLFFGLFWELSNHMWGDILKNIALFVPFGFVIGGRKGVLLGFLFSSGIEAAQYVTRLGYCELDDIMNNTIGAAVGAGFRYCIGGCCNMLRRWEDLPDFMRKPEVRPYWEALNRKRFQLGMKRAFDLCAGGLILVATAIPMGIIAVAIKLDSRGPVLYRQERVTTYGKKFRIHKFRTMVSDADKIGTAVTVGNDSRITKVGAKLRHLRLDEFPQLFDVISGNMSFVGTRPEAVKYVNKYKPEYNATLLMPAGITSEAAIRYKDEEKILDGVENVDQVYMEQVVPEKMKWNLRSIEEFSIFYETLTMFRTVFAVLGKDYE